jgi:hypothetical protein
MDTTLLGNSNKGHFFQNGPRGNGVVGTAYPSPSTTRKSLVTCCGRVCMHRKKINVSTVLAGQKLGSKEVDDGIWLVSFLTYDLGYIDLEHCYGRNRQT